MANYRSGFERTIATSLKQQGVKFRYESFGLSYTIEHIYTPDFVLPNGIIIEAKGLLDPMTRAKMVAVKKHHPDLDIRFVFMKASNKITKGSKTTYGLWAERNGFPWAEGLVPKDWLSEELKPTGL